MNEEDIKQLAKFLNDRILFLSDTLLFVGQYSNEEHVKKYINNILDKQNDTMEKFLDEMEKK